MAIENPLQLETTQRKIARLESSLDRMWHEESASAHRILSQGFIAQIEQMRREIDEYLDIIEPPEQDENILMKSL